MGGNLQGSGPLSPIRAAAGRVVDSPGRGCPVSIPTIIAALGAAYAGEVTGHVDVVSASSAVAPLSHGDSRYTFYPWATVDGDLRTCWQEAAEGPGIGESITYRFERPVDVDWLEVATGFQWPDHPDLGDLFAANGRVTALAVSADGAPAREVSLRDEPGWQRVCLDAAGVEVITLTLQGVAAGERWSDASISEVRFWTGRPAVTSREPREGPPADAAGPGAWYVTADLLSLRRRPDVSADRLNIIPFGTEVRTSGPVEGAEIPWHHLPDLDGYVSGEYLSESQPTGREVLALECRGYDSYNYSMVDLLILSSGVVHSYTMQGNPAGFRVSIGPGTYAVSRDSLSMKFGSTTSLDAWGETRTEHTRSEVRLDYSARYSGFLTPEQRAKGDALGALTVDDHGCGFATVSACYIEGPYEQDPGECPALDCMYCQTPTIPERLFWGPKQWARWSPGEGFVISAKEP